MSRNLKRIIGIVITMCAMIGGVVAASVSNADAMAYCYLTSTIALICTGDFKLDFSKK